MSDIEFKLVGDATEMQSWKFGTRKTGRIARALFLSGTAALMLSACDTLWPTLDADDPVGPEVSASADPAEPEVTADPSLAAPAQPQPVATSGLSAASNNYASAGGSSRTTFVSEKINQMAGDLDKMRGNISALAGRAATLKADSGAAAARYHASQAEIVSRLQQGTTPGNPDLVDNWNAAQADLESIAEAVPTMSQLSNDIADQGAFGQYLMSAVQATYGLSGAVEGDHIRLRQLEDQVHQAVIEVDRLLTDMSQDINRQNTYVSQQRGNMTTLSLAIKNGELYGTNLTTRSFTQIENQARAQARASQPAPGERPLVIIRFDQPNVQYQQALYDAVRQALDRKPDAIFNLLAVSPQAGSASQVTLNSTAAKRSAEDVLRTLTDMGVRSSRVTLLASTQDVTSNEVHVFVR